MKQKGKWIRKIATVMAVAMTVTAVAPMAMPAEMEQVEAASIRLSAKSKTLYVGKSFTLKVKGTKAKVKWSSSKSSVAKVSSKGKVTARKAGTAKIKAKVKGKTLYCKVTVKKKSTTKPTSKPTSQPTSEPESIWTAAPTKAPIEEPTKAPQTTEIVSPEEPAISAAPQTKEPAPVEEPQISKAPQPDYSTRPNPSQNPDRKYTGVTATYKQGERVTDLGVKFYLSEYTIGAENEQFVYLNVENSRSAEIKIEVDAFITTDGINYPAMNPNASSPDFGQWETVPGINEEEKPGYGFLIYDARDIVQGKIGEEYYYWLPSNIRSTFTFFFWVDGQRYVATVDFSQDGAVIYKVDDDQILYEDYISASPVPTQEAPTVSPSEEPVITPSEQPIATPKASKKPTAAPTSEPVADMPDAEGVGSGKATTVAKDGVTVRVVDCGKVFLVYLKNESAASSIATVSYEVTFTMKDGKELSFLEADYALKKGYINTTVLDPASQMSQKYGTEWQEDMVRDISVEITKVGTSYFDCYREFVEAKNISFQHESVLGESVQITFDLVNASQNKTDVRYTYVLYNKEGKIIGADFGFLLDMPGQSTQPMQETISETSMATGHQVDHVEVWISQVKY